MPKPVSKGTSIIQRVETLQKGLLPYTHNPSLEQFYTGRVFTLLKILAFFFVFVGGILPYHKLLFCVATLMNLVTSIPMDADSFIRNAILLTYQGVKW